MPVAEDRVLKVEVVQVTLHIKQGPPERVQGFRIGEHFAVHRPFQRDKVQNRGWSVTYLPTGVQVWLTDDIFRAVRAAEKLDELDPFRADNRRDRAKMLRFAEEHPEQAEALARTLEEIAPRIPTFTFGT